MAKQVRAAKNTDDASQLVSLDAVLANLAALTGGPTGAGVAELVERLLGRCDIFLDKVERFGELEKSYAPRKADTAGMTTAGPLRRSPAENAETPFVPCIASKPHQLVPLSAELLTAQSDPAAFLQQVAQNPSHRLEHPYHTEITACRAPSCAETLALLSGAAESKVMGANFAYVSTVDEFEEMLARLKASPIIAVDVEAHNELSFQGYTCLLQLSTPDFDWAADPLALRGSLARLNEVFCDPGIVKVLHGGDSDVKWLQRDFGLYFVNLLDTFALSRLVAPESASHSFASLLYRHLGFVVDKRFQRADWSQRPLPADMLHYARSDSHFLLPLLRAMLLQLAERARREELDAEEVFVRAVATASEVALRRYEKPPVLGKSYEGHAQQLEGGSRRQKELFLWLWRVRDGFAREKDLSVNTVCPAATLVALSQAEDFHQANAAAAASQRVSAEFFAVLGKTHKDFVDATGEQRASSTEFEGEGGPRGRERLARLSSALVKPLAANSFRAVNTRIFPSLLSGEPPVVSFEARVETVTRAKLSTALQAARREVLHKFSFERLFEFEVSVQGLAKRPTQGFDRDSVADVDDEVIAFAPHIPEAQPLDKTDLIKNILGLSISQAHKQEILDTVERKYREDRLEKASQKMEAGVAAATNRASKGSAAIRDKTDRPTYRKKK